MERSDVLQPNENLHICFDEEADIVEGGYAEGAVVKGFGGRVFGEEGGAEGGSKDAKGNVTAGAAFGGRGKSPERREARRLVAISKASLMVWLRWEKDLPVILNSQERDGQKKEVEERRGASIPTMIETRMAFKIISVEIEEL